MMKQKWVLTLGTILLLFSGCVRETVVVNVSPVTDADVYYEYQADAWGTVVQGELFNDGETYIDAIQLEIRLYDRRGFVIDYEYVWVETYFNPGQSVGFFVDLPHRGVWDVDVVIHRYH